MQMQPEQKKNVGWVLATGDHVANAIVSTRQLTFPGVTLNPCRRHLHPASSVRTRQHTTDTTRCTNGMILLPSIHRGGTSELKSSTASWLADYSCKLCIASHARDLVAEVSQGAEHGVVQVSAAKRHVPTAGQQLLDRRKLSS
jgi:hypothetical protein